MVVDNLVCIRTVHRGRVVEKVGFCWKYRENAVDNHVDNVDYCMDKIWAEMYKILRINYKRKLSTDLSTRACG